jgi:hypothetical protein
MLLLIIIYFYNIAIVKGLARAYNQINGGSANGNAFVDWRTKCIAVLNHYIYVPSLRARACARDPTTLSLIADFANIILY